MALKKENTEQTEILNSSEEKARSLFDRKEKKILTTFSIEPSFKKEAEELFASMGLSFAGGVRFAIKEFLKNRTNTTK